MTQRSSPDRIANRIAPSEASGVRRKAKYVGTTPYPLKGGGAFRGLPEDQRRLASEAYALWRALATERANPYSDHSAGLLAGRMALDATRWEDGFVILAAIRARMDEKSSPRRIPEWARLHGSDQRQNEHNARKQAEKAERDTIIEHQGTLYLGHVPDVVGSACVKCGGDLKAHRLARRSALRHIGEFLPSMASGLPAAPSGKGEQDQPHLYNSTSATGGGTDA